MTKPTRVEVNCATGEQTVVELTAAEIAELDQMRAKAEAERIEREAEAAAKAAAKQAAQDKLKALGLTDLEIAAITGA
jgi:uncharacterized membrane protein YqiK